MTTPSTVCYAPFQAQTIRVTRLDNCGAPVIGQKSTIVSDGLISVELKGNVDTGTDITVKNAKGDLKVVQPGKKNLTDYDVTVTMTEVDPDLFEMATGQTLVLDAKGNAVGIRQSESIPADTGIAIETWTKVGTGDGPCDGASELYGYFLTPYVVNGLLGDVTLNDGAMSCVFSGNTKRYPKWGTGPYDVVDTSAVEGTVTPGKLLEAIGNFDHLLMQVVTIAPPAPGCGAIALGAGG